MSDDLIHELRKYAQEEIAGHLVACSLGISYRSHHCGDKSESVDCIITEENKPRIALEVTSDADPKYEAMTNVLFSQINGEAISLAKGMGRWIINLNIGASIKLLTQYPIEDVLRDCLSQNCITINRSYLRSNHPIGEKMSALGIESMRRIDSKLDVAYRLMPSVSGCIDDSEDLLADYLEGLLNEKRISEKIDRLIIRSGSLTPHLAILTGSNSGLSINFRMNGLSLSDPKPTRTIKLPSGLDCLWFICTASSKTISYSSERGWHDFSLDNDSEPWWIDADLPLMQKLRKHGSGK